MVVIILSILVIILGYTTLNQMKKVEVYEDNLEQFYEQLSTVLRTMRELDQKQMFETDDEVGNVFQQIVETVNSLRPILYGIQDEEKEKDRFRNPQS